MQKRYWFKAKKYGWGWYPSTWQGWLVLSVFVFILIQDFIRIDSTSHSVSDTLRPLIIHTFFLTLLLIGVCYVTGEDPQWRWGEEKRKNK